MLDPQYVDSKSGRTIEIWNPADESLVSSDIQVADETDVDLAVAAARAAFEGPWRSLTGSERGELMIKFADLFVERMDEICLLETVAMGAPVSVVKFLRI